MTVPYQREGKIHTRSIELRQAWCESNPTKPWWGLSQDNKEALQQQIMEQATAEVDTEIEAFERSTSEAVWNSPLVGFVATAMEEIDRFADLRDQMEAELDAVRAKYEVQLPRPHQTIEAYNKARIDLFYQRVAEAGKFFCFGCHQPRPAEEKQLCLLDGQSLGGETKCTGYYEWTTRYFRLYELCACCRENKPKTVQLQKVYGGEETPVYCYVRRAALRDDGYWYSFDGVWEPVPQGTDLPPKLESVTLNDERCAEWEIPPELNLQGLFQNGQHVRNTLNIYHYSGSFPLLPHQTADV